MYKIEVKLKICSRYNTKIKYIYLYNAELWLVDCLKVKTIHNPYCFNILNGRYKNTNNLKLMVKP